MKGSDNRARVDGVQAFVAVAPARTSVTNLPEHAGAEPRTWEVSDKGEANDVSTER